MSARGTAFVLALSLAAGPAACLAQQAASASSTAMDDMPGMAPASKSKVAPAQPAQMKHAATAHGGRPIWVGPASMPLMATSNDDHVPPPAPTHEMPVMSATQMANIMQMDDDATRTTLLVDRLEGGHGNRGGDLGAWEIEGGWGNDLDRAWLETEGEQTQVANREARLELAWRHALSTFWDDQLGMRQDVGDGPARSWLGFGLRGLAPYWIDVQAGLYVGGQGRTALRVEASYDLYLSQRLILSPRLEANVYGKDDPRRQIRSGLSDLDAGLRLRYEISRRFAPYLGMQWKRRFASASTELLRHAEPTRETTWLLGVRFWF